MGWMIKARCVHVGPIRTFHKESGEAGRVASVELIDGSGDIKASMWDANVDEYYAHFRLGQVCAFLLLISISFLLFFHFHAILLTY
jgi:hypothetical protein